MLLFPPAKINIGLQILRRRDDGYHDLELSFFAVPQLCDVLEIVPAAAQAAGTPARADDTQPQDSFICTGLDIAGKPVEPGANLVEKARNLIRERASQKGITLPPCHIHLHKNIPSGSGLGGGSSDAAFTLTGLNRLFDLGFEEEELVKMAAELGSDCAFFARCGNADSNKADTPQPCIGQGKGEKLTPLQTGLNQNLSILICVPRNISISTAEAYRHCRPQQGRTPLSELLKGNIDTWKNTIENDFEKSLFPNYPALAQLKEKLYESGAVYASLSGSGSAVFALYQKEENLKTAAASIATSTNASAAADIATFSGRIAIP